MNSVQSPGIPWHSEYNKWEAGIMSTRRLLKVIFVALFFTGCAVAMATLAILTMDRPELEYISQLSWFMAFFWVLAAFAAALEP